MFSQQDYEDALGPDDDDRELAARGLRKARFDPDAGEHGEFEPNAAWTTLEDGSRVLAVKAD